MDSPMATRAVVDREKTAPFLVRTFVKIGGFHRVDFFEDGTLPTTDEHQIFTWKDASLKEVLTSLRLSAPLSPEVRHPLAKFAFRALYADATARGRITHRDLGTVYSRDVLGEPGTLNTPAARLLDDGEREREHATEHPQTDRSLEELRFVPGDYMCVSVILPKHLASGPGAGPGGDVAIRGAAAPGVTANGWKGVRAPSPPGPPGGLGRGGGHWRGGSDAMAGRGRPGGPGGSGRGERPRGPADRDVVDRDRERERDRRVPPPRRGRESPPHRGGFGGRDRDRDIIGRDRDIRRERELGRDRDREREGGLGRERDVGRGGGRSRSRSRSRSPPRRKARYD